MSSNDTAHSMTPEPLTITDLNDSRTSTGEFWREFFGTQRDALMHVAYCLTGNEEATAYSMCLALDSLVSGSFPCAEGRQAIVTARLAIVCAALDILHEVSAGIYQGCTHPVAHLLLQIQVRNRHAFILRVLEGMTPAESASVLEISPCQVNAMVSEALLAIRNSLHQPTTP